MFRPFLRCSLKEARRITDAPHAIAPDEVGFVDLIPGSGHVSGSYVNVHVYGTEVNRGGGHRIDFIGRTEILDRVLERMLRSGDLRNNPDVFIGSG